MASLGTDAPARPAHQTNSYLWGLRFIQILFTIIILGVTGSNMSDWTGLGCATPPHLSYNFAIGIISLIILIYVVLSTGPYIRLRWWNFIVAVALDLLFIIFWIAAAAVAGIDCDSACSVCSGPGAEVDSNYGYYVEVSDILCGCVLPGDYGYEYYKRRNVPSNIFRRGGSPVRSGSGSKTGNQLGKTLVKAATTAEKRGLDAAMIILFLISLATLVGLKYSSRSATQVQAEGQLNAEQVGKQAHHAYDMDASGA